RRAAKGTWCASRGGGSERASPARSRVGSRHHCGRQRRRHPRLRARGLPSPRVRSGAPRRHAAGARVALIASFAIAVILSPIAAWMVAPHDVWHLAGALAVELVLLNAVNLLDGLDGLTTVVTLAGAVGFSVVLDGAVSTLALALVGALAGFLVWNRPPARVYL